MSSYTPTVWEDEPSTVTPINATRLNNMEAGIVLATQAASEVQSGRVELATAAELTTGTDLVRAVSPKRLADYITARLAALPGASAASETVAGIVELATAGEMTTGTDLTRAPSVKRVADFVNTQIAGISGTSAATESAAGIVELASAAEMTTGTDLTRAPAVKRVADYVTAAITTLSGSVNTALAGKAAVSGSIAQFADVEDSAPGDTEVLRYDLGVNQWRAFDLSGQFATVGVDGRLSAADQPQYYVPLLVINEGDTVPSTYPTNGIVLSRPVGGGGTSLVPAMIGQNKAATGVTQVVVTLTDSVAVGDYLIFGVGTDASTTTGTLPTTHTFAYSTGAAAVTAGPQDNRSGTAQANIYYARCTVAIPSGATVTMTANQTRGHLHCTVAKVVGLFATIGTVVDRTSTTNNNNTALAITLPATSATAQASEVAFEVFCYNSGAAYPTPTRSLAPGSGWTQLGALQYTEGSSFRASIFAYRVLTSTGTVTGSATFTSSDGTTGPWAGVLATFKGA